jgi:hypothetical protein
MSPRRKRQSPNSDPVSDPVLVHRTYVCQFERCVTNISIDGLERLAQALEVDVVNLLKSKGLSKPE